LFAATGYKPQMGVAEGVANLVRWYKEFYNK
jgi:UDP-glucuronate 4-epimerase